MANMTDDRCAVHGHEPIPPEYYLICGECFHVFVTVEEFVEADRRMSVDCGLPNVARDPEEIFACPLCTHDL